MAITLSDPVILADELNARSLESEQIDIVVSFIKQSGLSLLLGSLRQFTKHGRLRVIITAYMSATEYAALAYLFSLPQHGGPHGTRRREVQAPHHMLHLQALRRHRDRIRRIRQHIEDRPHAGEKWVVKPRGEDVPMVFDDLQTTLYEGHLDTDKLMRYGEALRNHILEDVGREVSDASPTEKNGTPSARRTSGPWRTKTISARGTLHMIA